MQNLVDDLRPDFDRILIDSPPVLAVTDATILSHCADLTLLVVREELTTLRSLRRAHEILAADGTS
jgi:tyrosine-protein kinase Etk/Wzc